MSRDLSTIVLAVDARQERDILRFHAWETLGFNITDTAKVSVAPQSGLAKEGRLTYAHELSSLGVLKNCRKKVEKFSRIILRFLDRVPMWAEDKLLLFL